MRLGIATALLSMGLMGCRNTIMGSWKAYSWNKYELPMSLCERDLCHGVQDFTLEVDDALEGDFRLEIMEENEYYIYTFPLTAQLSRPDEQKDLWTMRVDNSENELYSEEWVCWVRGRIADCTIGEDTYQIKRR